MTAYACSQCGQSDRQLIPFGDGLICLNVDRCKPPEVSHDE